MIKTVKDRTWLASESSKKILCCYINQSPQVQIITLENNIFNLKFERLIFPGQRFLFEAVSGAKLQIHTAMSNGKVRKKEINCDLLSIIEQDSFFEPVKQ